jgi:hypothetical protein
VARMYMGHQFLVAADYSATHSHREHRDGGFHVHCGTAGNDGSLEIRRIENGHWSE